MLPVVLRNAAEAANMLGTETGYEHAVETIIQHIALHPGGFQLTLSLASLVLSETPSSLLPRTSVLPNAPTITRDIPMQMKHRGAEMRLVIGHAPTATPDATLLKTIARAHTWWQDIASGRVTTFQEIDERENTDKSYVAKVIPLAFLAPNIVEQIIAGTQAPDLTATKLLRSITLPLSWAAQQDILQ
jgi:site-specific DNA recombinase